MRIFEEKQAFRQWWLLLILSGILVVTGLSFFIGFTGFQTENLKYLGYIAVLFIITMFWIIRLHTRIDNSGIRTSFEPFGIFKKSFKWNDISKCYVRKYSPIREYGGWGIKGFNNPKAFNVSGNIGIQIITKDDKRFLIGTNKPKEAQRVIKRYQEKNKLK